MWEEGRGRREVGFERREEGGERREGSAERNHVSTTSVNYVHTDTSSPFSKLLESVNPFIPTQVAAASFRMQSTRHSSWEGVKIN